MPRSKTPHKTPEPPAPLSHEFHSVKCRSLTVEHPENPAKVAIQVTKLFAGIWLTTGREEESIGIVSDPHGHTYISFYSAGKGHHLPALAVGTDDKGAPFLQIVPPGEAGTAELERVRHLDLNEVVEKAVLPHLEPKPE